MNAHHHPWYARLAVGGLMILLAFLGLIVGDFRSDGAWNYWRWMVPVFALMCLWLSWYLRRKGHSLSLVKIWHEILHWAALIVAVYLISLFVEIGIMNRLDGSLMVITVLALTTFLAGVYIELSFAVTGLVLGLFSAGAAFADEYLFSVMLPITICGLALLGYLIHHLHNKPPPKP